MNRRTAIGAGLATLFALLVFAGCRQGGQPSLLSAQISGKGLRSHAQTPLSKGRVAPVAAQSTQVSFRRVGSKYHVTGIGPLTGSSYATAISDRGSVVGSCQTPHSVVAFLWSQGRLRRLSGLSAYDINDHGQMVGFKETSAGVEQPLLMNKGRLTLLGTMPGATSTYGYRINDRGQVVENALAGPRMLSRAFIWSGRRVWPLWTLPGFASSQGEAINSVGVVVGGATGPDGAQHACLWRHGQMIDLGALPGGNESFAEGIDKKGDVVGSSRTASGAGSGDLTHAFLWCAGRMMDLGVLDGWPQSEAAAINDKGQIVGNVKRLPAYGAHKVGHAFLWQRSQMRDLNDLIGPHSGWVLLDAVDINNRGQIVGNGIFKGHHRAFLLSPFTRSQPLLMAFGRMGKASRKKSAHELVGAILLPAARPAGKRMADVPRVLRTKKEPVERVAAYHDQLNNPPQPTPSRRLRWVSHGSETVKNPQLRQPTQIPIGFQGVVVARAHRPYTYTVEFGNLSRDIYLGPGKQVRSGDEIRVRGILQKNGVVDAHTMARLGNHHHNVLVAPR